MSLATYLKSDDFMSFRIGYPAAGFLSVFWGVVAFVVRFVLGAHTLSQAGTEFVVFTTAMFAAYNFGFYAKDVFISREKIETISGVYTVFSETRITVGQVAFGFAMVLAGWAVGTYLVSGSFTSLFWFAVYAATVAWYLRIGVRDAQWQGWRFQNID